ncbi:MAG TPA: CbtB domain-containing protein [Alphaproteobacteria bacterium]|jgi:cobalt transporter subunit CbtB|nr:CbtB domain-containing protein [Alphaproteobacteria bacterium]
MVTSQILTTTSVADRAVAAAIAALLGFFILFGVGFSTIPQVHNAGHDTRHSFAFPCH